MEKGNLFIQRNKKGKGVYAGRPFQKGEAVHILAGKIKTPKTLYYHGNNFRKKIIDPLQIGRDLYLELDSISVLFNHSCEPNFGIRDRSTLFALRDIKKGEEITYDYSTTIDESFWCTCGFKKCRKAVVDFFGLPEKLQMYYYTHSALSSFIKRKFEKMYGNKTRKS